MSERRSRKMVVMLSMSIGLDCEQYVTLTLPISAQIDTPCPIIRSIGCANLIKFTQPQNPEPRDKCWSISLHY